MKARQGQHVRARAGQKPGPAPRSGARRRVPAARQSRASSRKRLRRAAARPMPCSAPPPHRPALSGRSARGAHASSTASAPMTSGPGCPAGGRCTGTHWPGTLPPRPGRRVTAAHGRARRRYCATEWSATTTPAAPSIQCFAELATEEDGPNAFDRDPLAKWVWEPLRSVRIRRRQVNFCARGSERARHLNHSCARTAIAGRNRRNDVKDLHRESSSNAASSAATRRAPKAASLNSRQEAAPAGVAHGLPLRFVGQQLHDSRAERAVSV